MPAEVLFVGGRAECFTPIGAVTENTSSTFRESAFTDVAIENTSSNGVRFLLYTVSGVALVATTVVSGETFWLHFDAASGNTFTTTVPLLVLYDSSGFPWLRIIVSSGSATSAVQYNSGTGASPVWTTVGSLFTFSTTLKTVDLRVTIGSPHIFGLYVNGSELLTGTFTQASFSNIARVDMGASGANQNYLSQIAATRDICTIGAKVKTFRPTANGANTAWAGVFSDINAAVGVDTSPATSGTAGQKETHAMGDFGAVGAGVKIKSIWHWMRAKNDGVAPNNIKSVLRLSAVDYSSANLSGIGIGYAPIGARYDQNPATAADWTDSGWNAAEAGFESAT